MFIDYTATRELVGSGLDEIECDFSVGGDRVQKRIGGESTSMSGVGREFQLERLEYTWTFSTVPIAIADLPRWREFAASVANGETFTIDIDGTKAAPDNPITVSMKDGSYKENRAYKGYLIFSFTVLER